MNALATRTAAVWTALALTASGARAQADASGRSWLPNQGYFPSPYASVREPELALRALWSPLFRDRGDPAERPPYTFPGGEALRTELQGEAALGGTVKLWRPTRWHGGGLVVGVQAGVFGRFRLEVSSSDLVASDWVVAFPVEAGWGPWSTRLRLTHWSAHLGDELIEQTGAERVDFTSETLEALVGRRLGWARLYGGGAVVTRSSLENESRLGSGFSDDALVRLGADADWMPWAGGHLGLQAGFDWQAADRTGWASQVSSALAVVARNDDRSLHVRGVFHDGPSPLGQFFLTDERYWGIELILRIGPA